MEREKTNQPQMRNFPVLNQNYENGLCKSCPFIQSSSVDVKIICVHVCTHVYTCLHPKDTLYHRQERAFTFRKRSNAPRTSSRRNQSDFMLYLELFAPLAKQKSVAKPV